jgi:hypothetical protein
MLKPTQLREALTHSVPSLTQNPDSLKLFIENGRVVSTQASSLSFEYQYALSLAITDYADDPDLIIVPTLLWLRENQPDMMASKEQRLTGFTFNIDTLSGSLCNISMTLQLTERVKVTQEDDALHIAYPGEPPQPKNVDRPLQLYVHGELVSELSREPI